MKILLFTHGSDIDGMGSIIISKLYFNNIDYHFAEINDLDELITNEIKNQNIYTYDYIFVTDLTPKNETLAIIEKDKKLKDKFIVIDHHKTNYDRANNYQFVNIIVQKDNVMTCATSLFYDYLLNNMGMEEKKIVDEYAELTRLEDTWEWKKKNNNLAHNLTHLFNLFGRDKYIEVITNKLKNKDHFELDEKEKLLIDTKLSEIDKHINKYISQMKEITLNNHKGVIVIIEYEYRNELPEYLKENNYDYDFAMMVCFDHNSISFRSVNDCNVREIAEKFGGGGHDKAASCRIDNIIDKIYEILLNK